MMTAIACTSEEVFPWGCSCKSNGWDHDWDYATAASTNNAGLLWCGNCDCCIGWRPTPLSPGMFIAIPL